jgi:hypothetical protein
MVPGFNTDFKYRGETYHVQTEDNGVGNPVVVTLLYHKGAILASRRTPYQDLVGKPGFEQTLAALMKSQHKEIMRSLLAGTYDKNGAAPAIAGGSGKNPADAAAAVAGTTAKPVMKPLIGPASAAPRGPPRLRSAHLFRQRLLEVRRRRLTKPSGTTWRCSPRRPGPPPTSTNPPRVRTR